MTLDEFEAWSDAEVADGRLTQDERDDLVQQRIIFDRQRDTIYRTQQISRPEITSQEPRTLVVGFQRGRRFDAGSVEDLLSATETNPGLVYFEPVNYNPFGSALLADGGADAD